MKEILIKFTEVELNQISSLVQDNIRDGSYYGNKKYWNNRNNNIIEKIKKCIP